MSQLLGAHIVATGNGFTAVRCYNPCCTQPMDLTPDQLEQLDAMAAQAAIEDAMIEAAEDYANVNGVPGDNT